jgi:adenine-specific DNA-methyltransferase
MQNNVIQGDALAVMRDMADSSFDAIVTDPPYFGVVKEKWDNQWKNRSEFLAWIGELADEWKRLLRPNGSLYVFASPGNASGVEEEIRKRFDVLNHVVWDKGLKASTANRARKEALRAYAKTSERVIFAQHYGADGAAKGEPGYRQKCEELCGFVFEPLRNYIDGEWTRAGLTRKEANLATGTQMAGHYLSKSQWALPTKQHYEALRDYANRRGGEFLGRDYEFLCRDYELLRRDYEDLRQQYENLRRPFFLSSEKQWGDVWKFQQTSRRSGRHPCEKPQPLLEHIITTSTRPGGCILDCFGGSGSLAEAAIRLGRVPTLIELDPLWVERAQARIDAISATPVQAALPFAAE